MATSLSSADLTAIETAITTQVPDYANLLPSGVTLAEFVANAAVEIVDEMNAYLRTVYGDGTDLPATALTIAKLGVKAQFLASGYEYIQQDEQGRVAEAWERYYNLLRQVAAQGGGTTATTPAPQVASEPRRFTTDDDLKTTLTTGSNTAWDLDGVF